MPQTKKRRRKKHRGTQGGSIDRRRARGRPRTRDEARAQAKLRAEARRDSGPTWGGALMRGLFGAGIFMVLMLLLFDRPFGEAVGLSVAMLAIYVPLGYQIDRFFWKRRQKARRTKAS